MEKEGNTGTYTCTVRSTPDYLLLSFFFPPSLSMSKY